MTTNIIYVNHLIPNKPPVHPIGRIALLLLILLIISSSISYYLSVREINQSKEYIKQLKTIHAAMYEGIRQANELTDLTTKTWYNTIHEINDPNTNAYTAGKNKDFNQALIDLFNTPSTKDHQAGLTSNQLKIAKMIEKLYSPENKIDKYDRQLTDLYQQYQEFMRIATNPSGSYKEYSSKCATTLVAFNEKHQRSNLNVRTEKNR